MTGTPRTTAVDAEPELADRPEVSGVLRRFVRNPLSVVAVGAIALLVVMAVFAPVLAPRDPQRQDIMNRLKGPGAGVLGTDDFGRDVLSRLIYGSRVSLIAVAIALTVNLLVGVPLGLLAGYVGGWVDALLNRVTEAVMSVPGLFLIFTVVAVLGSGLVNASIAIGILGIPRFYRVSRAATKDVRHETYVEASRALGCTTRRTITRHVLPNVLGPLVVQAATASGGFVAAEASLSFLQVGIKPETISWGGALNTAVNNIARAPYLVYAPGAMIMATVLAFIFVGDGLRSALGTSRDALRGTQ
jgi:peptide/nickel transport system permease protein